MSNFFTSLFGGGNTASGYAKTQSGLIKRNTALVDTLRGQYDALNGTYAQARREGAFDPNAQLDLLARDNAYASKVQTGNAAVAARVAGYRPGDSAPLQQIGAIGQRAQLDYDQLANGIRNQAMQGNLNAADRLAGESSSLIGQSSNVLGQSIGTNGQLLQNAQAQDAQQGQFFGQLLGSAMPFLNPTAGIARAASTIPFYRRPDYAKTLAKGIGTGVASLRF